MSKSLSMRRLAALGAALVLLLGGCGDAEPAPQATATASPSPSPSPVEEVAPSPDPPEVAASPSPSPVRPAPPAPPPAAPAPAPPPPPAPAAANPVTGPAAAGQYIFDEKGTLQTQGCLVASQNAPTPTRLNVGGLEGNRQSINRDQTGPGSAGSISNAVFEYREDGAYLVSLSQEQRVSGQVLLFDFTAGTPSRVIPAFPQVGETGSFSLTSADGAVRVDAGTTVEAVGEPVTLGQGERLNTVRLRTTTRISGSSSQGSLDLNVTRTSWYSTDKHLEVKDVTDTTGTVGLCRVNFHVESLARAV